MKQMQYHLMILLTGFFWLNHAANDIPSDAHMVLRSAHGVCREIKRAAIRYSVVLNRALLDNPTTSYLLCNDCTDVNELCVFTHLLDVMHCAQIEQWDTAAVEKRLENCYRHNPVTVAGIASCYDMPVLKELIAAANEKVVQGHSIQRGPEQRVAATYATVRLWREKLNGCRQEDLRPLVQQGLPKVTVTF